MCLFCDIAKGESPCFKIWEDEKFMAFLDIFPNTKGQSIVIPKKHYDSDLFLIQDPKFYKEYLSATQEVVEVLKRGLGVQRVSMIMEGMGVNHVHLKLYPLIGLSEEWKPTIATEEIYFQQYEGYLSTQPWPKADMEMLGALQTQIVNGDILN